MGRNDYVVVVGDEVGGVDGGVEYVLEEVFVCGRFVVIDEDVVVGGGDVLETVFVGVGKKIVDGVSGREDLAEHLFDNIFGTFLDDFFERDRFFDLD